jgi:glyoxylase-like metal-dependent hydrolase (beta-lactamase superfamily II)
MQEIGPEIWRIAGPDLRFPGGVWMPLASTLVRLPDGSLVVYSPIAFDEAQFAAIAELGEVAHVVVPSLLHHLHAERAAVRWPRATIHAADGVLRKRPSLRVDRILGTDPEPAWRDTLDVETVAGAPKLGETVLFHHPSRTLICADLVFHITQPRNLRTRVVLATMGVGGGRIAQSRAWRFAVSDRDAARASIDRILAWPIARVAPAHGEPGDITARALAERLSRVYRGRPLAGLSAASAG